VSSIRRPPANGGEPGFDEITETTGTFVLPEGADMLVTRYAFASDHSEGRRVLELGCGGGQGFGLLLRKSSSVIGGDFSAKLLAIAQSHYHDRVPLVRLDAQALPFPARSFDVVLIFEAAYYIPDLGRALREVTRVLTSGGACLIVSANPQRPDFIPSPFSVRYHSARELAAELKSAGLQPELVQAAFPTGDEDLSVTKKLRGRVLALSRKMLARSGFVPKTLKGRSRLKRFLYYRQLRVPPELSVSFGSTAPRVDLDDRNSTKFKVVYLLGRKPT